MCVEQTNRNKSQVSDGNRCLWSHLATSPPELNKKQKENKCNLHARRFTFDGQSLCIYNGLYLPLGRESLAMPQQKTHFRIWITKDQDTRRALSGLTKLGECFFFLFLLLIGIDSSVGR